ncbi:MAG: hypothetical protein ACLQA5_06305 [Solirubrobacteraceae bacterium]
MSLAVARLPETDPRSHNGAGTLHQVTDSGSRVRRKRSGGGPPVLLGVAVIWVAVSAAVVACGFEAGASPSM